MTTLPRLRRPLVVVPAAVLAALMILVVALSLVQRGTDAGSDSTDTASLSGGGAELKSVDGAALDASVAEAPRRSAVEEKVVSHGSVTLRSKDVAALRFDVQAIADESGGEVVEERTDTGEDGKVLRSRMVLRVPTEDFDATMQALEQAGDLVSSRQGSDVVTQEYVDLQARVRAQEKSLERVEVLFTRANSIRDIMAIEAQLTRRQADLDALKGQLRYLEDRTSTATVAVHLQRTPSDAVPVDEDGGFLAGLAAGWSAFTAFLTGIATVTGAVLPFAVTLLLLGLPAWLLVRRSLRHRRTAVTAE